MRIANLRAGDCFLFDHELAECCAVADAVVVGSGDVAVAYEGGREVQHRVFDSSVEVDLIGRTPNSAGIVRPSTETELKATTHGY
jgi:hypothetical protein